MNSFFTKLTAKWQEDKFLSVGLDQSDFEFNKKIIDKTIDLVCSYKPNSAFYEAAGTVGLQALKKTIDYIKEKAPDTAVILDAKRGDIESTNKAYAEAIFDNLGVDAVTVSPYLGKESLKPFLERTDKGVIVLVKTSNPGAAEFQDLEVYLFEPEPQSRRPESLGFARDKLRLRGKPLYQVIAEHVKTWNTNGNCGVVVGATYPKELAEVRKIVGDMLILIPGIGSQGGDLAEAVKAGLNSQKQGIIINVSRAVSSAPNPRQAALKIHQEIICLI